MTKTTSISDRMRTLRCAGRRRPARPAPRRFACSMLTVTAGPLPAMTAFTKYVDNKIVYMDYVCEGPSVISATATPSAGWASGSATRPRPHRTGLCHPFARPAFQQGPCRELEDRLIEIARANLVPLANDPEVGGLGGKDARSPEIEELLRDARRKLWFAGCRLFERQHPAGPATTIVCEASRSSSPKRLRGWICRSRCS